MRVSLVLNDIAHLSITIVKPPKQQTAEATPSSSLRTKRPITNDPSHTGKARSLAHKNRNVKVGDLTTDTSTAVGTSSSPRTKSTSVDVIQQTLPKDGPNGTKRLSGKAKRSAAKEDKKAKKAEVTQGMRGAPVGDEMEKRYFNNSSGEVQDIPRSLVPSSASDPQTSESQPADSTSAAIYPRTSFQKNSDIDAPLAVAASLASTTHVTEGEATGSADSTRGRL